MNEFSAKKLGEVLAFSRAGVEIFTRAESALKPLFAEYYDEVITELNSQKSALEDFISDQDTKEVTQKKAEGTKAKLIGMAETYIGNAWDDPAECMEWLGFFEGAAIVHWKIVEGIGTKVEHAEIRVLAEKGLIAHRTLLTTVEEKIKLHGEERASNSQE